MHSTNTEPLFQQELSVKNDVWTVDTDVHTSILHTTQQAFFSVFFGLCPGGAGTMEFQYHNCLFLCVPASEITGKKEKKYT